MNDRYWFRPTLLLMLLKHKENHFISGFIIKLCRIISLVSATDHHWSELAAFICLRCSVELDVVSFWSHKSGYVNLDIETLIKTRYSLRNLVFSLSSAFRNIWSTSNSSKLKLGSQISFVALIMTCLLMCRPKPKTIGLLVSLSTLICL